MRNNVFYSILLMSFAACKPVSTPEVKPRSQVSNTTETNYTPPVSYQDPCAMNSGGALNPTGQNDGFNNGFALNGYEGEQNGLENGMPNNGSQFPNGYNDPYSQGCANQGMGEAPQTDNESLNKCMKHWHSAGISLPATGNYRVIKQGVQVLGFGNSNINDTTITDQYSVILVKTNVSVLSSSTWNLRNPKGLYCVSTSTNVLSNLTINISKTANIAMVGADVNVIASNSDGIGGVNVLSGAKIELH